MAEEEKDEELYPAYYIDGKKYASNKLTFREDRRLRDLIRELRDDPEAETLDATVNEFALALTVLVKNREDESYDLEQALDLDISDVVKWEPVKARPTRAKRTPAKSTS
jgi:hypothetical protein